MISLWFLFLVCPAQSKDTVSWKPFELIAGKATSNAGAVKINMPLPYSGSLADVIGTYSALFIKSYSPGNLASTSMRGMGAQHTAVLWNGVNLQSVMNSNIDLNLLPVFFFDQAAIETGANASSAANGSIAGAIYINNDIKKVNRSFGELTAGSFGLKSAAIGTSLKLGKWSFTSRFLNKESRNDFQFVNYFMAGKPTEKLRNSQFAQSGFMQEVQYNFDAFNKVYVNYWYLQTSRNLPPAMGIANTNDEHQDDFSHKLLIAHQAQISSKFELNNKFAFVNEQINYFNLLLSPAFNNANSYMFESAFKWKVSTLLELGSSLSYTEQDAKTDGYAQGRHRHLISLWSGFIYNSKNKLHRLSLGSRQLMMDGNLTPASPDFGIDLGIHKHLKWKSNLAAGYRIPSFNDLYWQAGGNPNLKPEQSKKAETTLEGSWNGFKTAVTGFMHQVNNWILWTPDPVSQIWKANNAKSVSSRGIEVSSEYRMRFSDQHDFKIFGRYQFVRSINTQVYQSDSSALGKQLFYTPGNTAALQFQYRLKSFFWNIGLTYTGSVFTTADNNPENRLNPYTVFNSGIAYDFRYKSHTCMFAFKVFNLGNATYQVMENRPMPLRNYQVSIKFNINYDK